ncbi:MAG: Crp/Fnr family transcriptional regulator [Hyphomicrobiales bacterium]|nr:Crp/Fnr family transcriptional regulator [Hyphomicrobiales bacterium]
MTTLPDRSAVNVPCLECPLRQRTAFKPKSDEEIAFIQSMEVQHRRVGGGAEIVHQGQIDPELFTLFSGWAYRHKTLPDGRRQILNFLLPGDILGSQASLLDASDHSIEALTDVELCVFSRRRIWSLFERMPQLAFELSWFGAREENRVDEALTSVGQRTARERMAALVLSLDRRCDHLDMVSDGGFTFPLTRQHLADTLGLSLVHTIKTWSHLRVLGLFRLTGGRLFLLNPRLTERWANDYDTGGHGRSSDRSHDLRPQTPLPVKLPCSPRHATS